MQHRPDTLADWCAKWLDGSQWRQLQKAVNRQLSAPSTQSD
jgi:hypothetical protein